MWGGSFPCVAPQGDQKILDIVDWKYQPNGGVALASQQSAQTAVPHKTQVFTTDAAFCNQTWSYQTPPTPPISPEYSADTTSPDVNQLDVKPRITRRFSKCECPNCQLGHSGKKRHSCHFKDCGRAYSKTSHLRSHLRAHTGERPYSCIYCAKKFIRSDELKRHERIHTGEKNYKCKECDRRFGRSDHRKKHEATHAKPNRRMLKWTSSGDTMKTQQLRINDNCGYQQIQYLESPAIQIPVSAQPNTFVELNVPEMNFAGFENLSLPNAQGQKQLLDFDFLSQLEMQPVSVAAVATAVGEEFFISQMPDQTSHIIEL